jgi:hypothetical protein
MSKSIITDRLGDNEKIRFTHRVREFLSRKRGQKRHVDLCYDNGWQTSTCLWQQTTLYAVELVFPLPLSVPPPQYNHSVPGKGVTMSTPVRCLQKCSLASHPVSDDHV